MPHRDKRTPKPDLAALLGSPRMPEATSPAKPPGEARSAAQVLGPPASAGPTGTTASSGPKPDFSKVQSGGSSTATVVEARGAETFYTVQAGDSLSKIAQHTFGHARLWRQIFEANRDTINNPDLIYPGQVLRLPSIPQRGRA